VIAVIVGPGPGREIDIVNIATGGPDLGPERPPQDATGSYILKSRLNTNLEFFMFLR